MDIAELLSMYTTNRLTLSQTFYVVTNYLFEKAQFYKVPPFDQIIAIIGHKFCNEDLVAIEVGFEGDVNAWYAAGNKPRGWNQLFSDNYAQYKETELCTPANTTTTEKRADAPSVTHASITESLANLDAKRMKQMYSQFEKIASSGGFASEPTELKESLENSVSSHER